MGIAFTLGVGLGVIVAVYPGGALSRFIMAGSLCGISIPTFLIGILLVMAFSVYLNILPPFGRGDTVQIGFWRTGLLTLSGGSTSSCRP
jgi:peptide/nickel transport system permease protein